MRKNTKKNILLLLLNVMVVGAISWWCYNTVQGSRRPENASRHTNEMPDSVAAYYAPYVQYAQAMQLQSTGQQEAADSILILLKDHKNDTLRYLAQAALRPVTVPEGPKEEAIRKPSIRLPMQNAGGKQEPDEVHFSESENIPVVDRKAETKKPPVLNLVNQNGKKFEFIGAISNGKANGYGVAEYETGSTYKGSWKNNMKHGKGIFMWKDGERYDGNFVNDLRDGSGKYTWSNGEYYEGEWKKDQRNGKGTLYRKNGKVKKSGSWQNDEFIGK